MERYKLMYIKICLMRSATKSKSRPLAHNPRTSHCRSGPVLLIAGFASPMKKCFIHSKQHSFRQQLMRAYFFCALVCQICGFFRVQFIHPRTVLRALVMPANQGFVNPVTILPRILQSCGRPENRKLEK